MRAELALSGAVLLLLVVGCSVEPLTLEGRTCPCVDGWVCEPSSNTCVPSASGDAGMDSSPPDGLVPDAAVADSSPSDGSAPDASAADSSLDTTPADTGPGPTGCDDVHAGRVFCDGFEDTGFAAWDSDITPGASTVEVVSDPVYRGTGALRAVAAPDERRASVFAEVFPVPEPANQWLRSYFYIPSSTPPGMELSEMTDDMANYNFIVYTRSGTEHDFHTHGWSNGRQPLDTLLPTDTWFCLEAHLELGAGGSISVYLDDALVATETGLDNTTPRGLSRIYAGIAWNESGDERVLYVDEVVADTERIGCD